MDQVIKASIHPTIRKCLQHLDVIHADDRTKQIVYMYMESLYKEMDKQSYLNFRTETPFEQQINN